MHEANLDKYLTYGPIVKEDFEAGNPVVHLFDPTDFARVFRSQGKHPIRPAPDFVRHYRSSRPDRYPTIGIANSNGEEWFNERQRLAPVLLKLGLTENHCPQQNAICDDLVEYLRNRPSTLVKRVQDLTDKLALESIASLCLGIRLGIFKSSDSTTTAGRVLSSSTRKLFESYNELYYGMPVWKVLPSFLSPSFTSYVEAEENIYNTANTVIMDRINKTTNHDKNTNNCPSQVSPSSTGCSNNTSFQEPRTDYLYDCDKQGNDDTDDVMTLKDTASNTDEPSSCLFETLLKDPDFDRRNIPITVTDFMSGGIFAVSNSLTYILYHLSCHPRVQEDLFTEIVTSMSSKETSLQSLQHENISTQDLSNMPLLKAVMKESFRLTSIIPAVVRILGEETILSGYRVPKGVSIDVNFFQGL